MWYTNSFSNRQGIVRIQSGVDRVWENIPKTVDNVNDRVRVNGSVSYGSPITRNTKHQVSYANIVRVDMRK